MYVLYLPSALQLQSQMYLTNEETAVILSLITCTCPPFSPAGVRFIQITLSMLLACPFLIRWPAVIITLLKLCVLHVHTCMMYTCAC